MSLWLLLEHCCYGYEHRILALRAPNPQVIVTRLPRFGIDRLFPRTRLALAYDLFTSRFRAVRAEHEARNIFCTAPGAWFCSRRFSHRLE